MNQIEIIAANQAAVAAAQAALDAANATLAADQAKLDAIQPHLILLAQIENELVTMDQGLSDELTASLDAVKADVTALFEKMKSLLLA